MERETKISKAFEYKKRKCVILWVGSHYCAYVETKLKDCYYGTEFGTYDTSPSSCVDCHGGITFGASKLSITPFDKEIQYFGCDYAHAGDYCDYGPEVNLSYRSDEKKWTLEEVEKETEEFADSLIAYEKVYHKYKKAFENFEKEIKLIKEGKQ